MSAGKRWILKTDDHKKKYTSWKKSHLSGGMIDLWYLEWQKQEILFKFLFTFKFIRFRILHSNCVRLNLSISCFIMGCLHGNVIVITCRCLVHFSTDPTDISSCVGIGIGDIIIKLN